MPALLHGHVAGTVLTLVLVSGFGFWVYGLEALVYEALGKLLVGENPKL